MNRDAFARIDFTNDAGSTATYNLAFGQFLPAGGPTPGRVKYLDPNGGTSDAEFFTNSSTSVSNANSVAIVVGAADYINTPAFGQTPPLPEDSTSLGGTPILLDKAGKRLATPEVRDNPDITAVDGTNTTFFGEDRGADEDTFGNFFGTSAAAPHAAGVVALMLQAKPDATPQEIEEALEATAIDMLTPGYDRLTGFGFIQADAAIANLLGQTLDNSIVVNALGDVDDGDLDNGITTLREAINFANRINDVNTITFDLAANSTITLATSLLVKQGVTIDGSDVSGLSISGSTFNLFNVDKSLSINNLGLNGGRDAINLVGESIALNLTDVSINNTRDDGIDLRSSPNAQVNLNRVTISNVGRDGIEIANSNGVVVTMTGSEIRDSGQDNIDIMNSANTQITLDGSDLLGAARDGIEFSQSADGIINLTNGSSIQNSIRDGIEIEDSSGVVINISDSEIGGSGQDNIEIENSNNAQINLTDGASLENARRDGIEIEESSGVVVNISDSEIGGSGQDNIEIEDSANAQINLTDGATIENARRDGIEIERSSGVVVNISDSEIKDSGQDNIEIENSNNAQISLTNGATIEDAKRDGIDIQDSNGAVITITDSEIGSSGQDNIDIINSANAQITLNNGDLLGATRDGIELSNSNNVNISLTNGSTIEESGRDGIEVVGGSIDLLISGSTVANNGDEDLNLSGATTQKVTINGTNNADILTGSDVGDVITGGAGDDLLTGNGAADIFVFGFNSGKDTVTDYTLGQDILDVSALGITSFNQMTFSGDTVFFNDITNGQVSVTGINTQTDSLIFILA